MINSRSDVGISGVFPLLFLFGIYLYSDWKKKKDIAEAAKRKDTYDLDNDGTNDKAGGIVVENAQLSPTNARSIASQLVDLLVKEYYISDFEEQAVKSIFNRIPDEAASYALVYDFFGSQNSYLPPVSGDLNNFMRSRISFEVRKDCYKTGSTFL
jgi:hypothetical protein